MKTLPGITAVEFLPANELVIYPKRILSPGDVTSAIGNYAKLPMVGMASCSHTNERTNAGLVYTTKVAGLLYESEDMNNKKQNELQETFQSFRLTDIYKDKYLVGTDKKPFPEINFAPANDAAPDGMRAVNFEITWISTLPPLELVSL